MATYQETALPSGEALPPQVLYGQQAAQPHQPAAYPIPSTDPGLAPPLATAPAVPALEPQILLVLVGLPGSGKTSLAEALVRDSEGSEAGQVGMGVTARDGSVNMLPTPSYSALSTATSSTSSFAAGPSSTTPPSVLAATTSTKPARRRWIRASQDDAPSKRRQECEARVRRGLSEGCNVVVDRVGFDAVQRSHFIAIADTFHPRPLVYCLILSVSRPTLSSRLSSRLAHPTIPDATTGLRVLAQMGGLWAPPRVDGGEGFDSIYEMGEGEQPREEAGWERVVRGLVERVGEEGKREVGGRKVVGGAAGGGGGGGWRGRGRGGGRGGEWRGGGGGGGFGGQRGGFHSQGYRQPTDRTTSQPISHASHAPAGALRGTWRDRSRGSHPAAHSGHQAPGSQAQSYYPQPSPALRQDVESPRRDPPTQR
ncbi:hypothetical protein IAT38_001469 [Cryptococcus sp. DSM 104549]